MIRIPFSALWLVFLLFLSGNSVAEVDAQAVASVPRQFYQAVNAKDYATPWAMLSEASKARLTTLVAEEAKMPVDQVRQLFDSNDPSVQNGFWNSFRGSAQPEVLVGLNYAYKGEGNGGYLVTVSSPDGGGEPLDVTVKDEGGYKFGLAETYGF